MERIKKIFKVEFNQDDINEMNFFDGILAICFYFIYIALIFTFGLFMFKTNVYHNLSKFFENNYLYRFIFYIPITIISILLILLIVFLRNQKINSLGIRRTNLLKSILVGIFFSLPLVIPSVINGFIHNYKLTDMKDLVWIFLYYLICIGFVEELAFRGFIQTRIRGIVKNKWLSIILVGLMFGAMHIPFQMLNAKLTFLQFIQQDLGHLVTTMIIHIYLVYIYTRDNNIIAPTITHAIINFIPYIYIYI